MSLEVVSLTIDSLVPIQSKGVGRPRLLELAGVGSLPPVQTVVYEDDKNLLLDGHHRAYLAFQAGRNTVDALLATDDEEMFCMNAPALSGCMTLEAAHARYDKIWYPLLVQAGINDIASLPLHDNPRWS